MIDWISPTPKHVAGVDARSTTASPKRRCEAVAIIQRFGGALTLRGHALFAEEPRHQPRAFAAVSSPLSQVTGQNRNEFV